MAHYALSVIHPVARLEQAARFLIRGLDFHQQSEGEDWCVVEGVDPTLLCQTGVEG